MSSSARIRSESLPDTTTASFKFNGHPITITSAHEAKTVDVNGILRDPTDFHGSTQVHDVVEFGAAFAGLIGEYQDPEGFFEDSDELPDKGVVILADHFEEAADLVQSVDKLAQQVIAEPRLYDDRGFCQQYLDLARAGYGLLRDRLPHFEEPIRGIPVSLERAGLVITRLAQEVDLNEIIPDEIRVVTKRAHPKSDSPEDLMVSVKWRNLEDISRLGGKVVEVADFVNPASWASTAAMLVSAHSRGGIPSTVVHRSFMATEQGIVFSRRALEGEKMGNIRPVYYTVGTSKNLTPQYYLYDPAVADAGHVLRHFLPDWYEH